MKIISTPVLCKKSMKGVKTGRTVPELAAKTGASIGTARRSINRLMERGEAHILATRKCRETGKVLNSYAV